MGWTTTHRAKGQSNDAWFQANVIGDRHEIVTSSTIKGVYYAAVRTIETGQVWGLVVLTQRSPRSQQNFGWKDMDETMGPNAAEASAKVLDALTETDNECAREWRAACRTNLERKAKTLEPGTVVRLANPLTFWVGGAKVKVTEFTYAPQPRRLNIFSVAALDSRILVSLPDWRKYSFEVVSA